MKESDFWPMRMELKTNDKTFAFSFQEIKE